MANKYGRPPGFTNWDVENDRPYVVPPHISGGINAPGVADFDYGKYQQAQKTGDFSGYMGNSSNTGGNSGGGRNIADGAGYNAPATTPSHSVAPTPGLSRDYLNGLYNQYFDRDIKDEGYNYWSQSDLRGNDLKNAMLNGADPYDSAAWQRKLNGLNNPTPAPTTPTQPDNSAFTDALNSISQQNQQWQDNFIGMMDDFKPKQNQSQQPNFGEVMSGFGNMLNTTMQGFGNLFASQQGGQQAPLQQETPDYGWQNKYNTHSVLPAVYQPGQKTPTNGDNAGWGSNNPFKIQGF